MMTVAERIPSIRRSGVLVAAVLTILLAMSPRAAAAQDVEERFPGVSLGITYEGRQAATLAIQPFTAETGDQSLASRVQNIVGRDLRYSNRFQVLDSLPAALTRDQVDYGLWDQVQADFLVTGRIEGAGMTATLVLELHDVVYREVVDRGRFPVPNPESSEFRMAVHVASDAVVEWATGEPGFAASRIAYVQRMEDGTQEIWVIDSDGENRRRVTAHGDLALSPAWSPDRRRVAYVSYHSGLPRIYELDLDTGHEKSVPAPREGDYVTPTYMPDGETLVFGVLGGAPGLFSYNVARECCFANLSEGAYEDVSPSFSPDGTRFAFNSNRLGVGAPQVYVRSTQGGGLQRISPYAFDRPGYYTSPEWSPIGDRIAYHGRVERRGVHQILVSELDQRNRVVRVTTTGVNEDPSWAPDGRHLVYVGVRDWGRGLFVVDVVTGNERTLVSGVEVKYPSWSGSFAPDRTVDR